MPNVKHEGDSQENTGLELSEAPGREKHTAHHDEVNRGPTLKGRMRSWRRDLVTSVVGTIIALLVLFVAKTFSEIQATILLQDMAQKVKSVFRAPKPKVVLAVFPYSTTSTPIRSGLGFGDENNNRGQATSEQVDPANTLRVGGTVEIGRAHV